MTSNHKILPKAKQTFAAGNTSKPRKPYHKPQLEELGDLRALTLGGSPGIGDSGMGYPEFPIGFYGMSLPDGYPQSEYPHQP